VAAETRDSFDTHLFHGPNCALAAVLGDAAVVPAHIGFLEHDASWLPLADGEHGCQMHGKAIYPEIPTGEHKHPQEGFSGEL